MDLIFVGMLLLIFLQRLLEAPEWVHQVLLGVIVLVGFGLVMQWLWANADGIQNEEDLRRDAEMLKRDPPITERQALYRLTMMHREEPPPSSMDETGRFRGG
jgi:hypothetical protein